MKIRDFIRNLSLSKKIKSIVMLSTALALVLSSIAFVWLAWNSLRNSVSLDAIGLADAIGNTCSAALLFNDSNSAREIMAALSSDHRILQAAVLKKDGKILAAYNKRSSMAARPITAQPKGLYFGDESLTVIRGIIMDGEQIGSICVRMSLDSVFALFRKIVLIMVAITTCALFFTYFISSRLQTLISGPVQDLAQTVKSISAHKNYSLRATKTAQDEVGDLIDGFNEMLEQIRNRDEALRRHSSEVSAINEQLSSAIVKAEQASKAKSEFLAKMSHEFRTPLNAIIGYSELLKEEMEENDETEFLPDLAKIHTAAKHLLALINDILDLSKIEAGRMELHPEHFKVQPLVEDVLNTVRDMVEKNGNQLKLDCAGELGDMNTDALKLRQILINLIGNAGKFTKGGQVSVHVSRFRLNNEDWLRMRVKDTGIGISPEDAPKLFQAFSQADGSTTRKYGGTGLGLAISQRFAHLMGGDIQVESILGQGSTFQVDLPAQIGDLKKSGTTKSEQAPTNAA